MNTEDDKIKSLENIIKKCKKAAIAFSGGVDSSFLLYKCIEALGKENVISITGVSESYTKEEHEFVKTFSEQLGVKQLFVNTSEFENINFIDNPKERCYYCKLELYKEIKKISALHKISFIFDGTNYSDRGDYRPGRAASKEFGVISPLYEAELTKEEIRSLLKKAGFVFYDKPANPCLASRIPYGEKITKEKLSQIDHGEKFLKELGFSIVRLRNHGELARIEIEEKDFHKLLEKNTRDKISAELKKSGFIWVSFDINGYRTGSLNEKILAGQK